MSAPVASSDWKQYMAGMAATTRHAALADFYRSPWPTADTALEELELVALDVETTGLDARRHAIVSIGLIPLTLNRIRSDAAWYQLLRPSADLIPESIAFHRITHSDIRRAPRFGDILEELLAQLAGKVAVVHYHPIERGFIDQAVRQAMGEGLQFPLIDTMEIEAKLHPRRRTGWLAPLLRRKPASLRLADCRNRYGLPPYRAHHALTDALATAELLQAQVAKHFTPQQPVSSLWM